MRFGERVYSGNQFVTIAQGTPVETPTSCIREDGFDEYETYYNLNLKIKSNEGNDIPEGEFSCVYTNEYPFDD